MSSPTAPFQSVAGSTLLFPVIGHPVKQVRAPSVFNALFAAAGVDALCFGLDLHPHTVAETCRALLESPTVGGILVTVPYKKTLAGIVETLGPSARHVGAVNALRRSPDGGIEGDLFDGIGFVRGLQAAGHAIAGRSFLLLGAGGAGSAIAAALADAGAGELGIYDPVAPSVEALAGQLGAAFPRVRFTPQEVLQPAGYDVVVQASPLGLRPEDPLPLDPSRLAPGTLVCDIIMKPEITAFLHAAAACGLRVHRGRHMLDQQVPLYLNFFGLDQLARRVHVGADAVTLAGLA